ncbi:histidinol-phosphate transaminase [Spirulina subsalsa]|uniref:histidinol-phosphate transaminase n=1 Tax=Spirulina subsalsa TaxID=54311 RepID=UPI00030634E2|nr:histidinol-phosphate transaminase [Spirulina subsalsa]
MFNFIRSDLAQLKAYTPHPGGEIAVPVDQLDTNENPYDLPPWIKGKLARLYQMEMSCNRYPDGSHSALKEAIANYVNHSAHLPSSPIDAHHISVGNGSDELIRSLLIATCLGQEGQILVAHPTFSMYGILAQTLRIGVVSVGRSPDTFEIDLNAAQQALEQTQNPPIRVVFLVHPNSPTANALTEAELAWLREIPEQVLVVIDEAYFEFSRTSVVGELAEHPNWVILRTFSKAFRLAALRVGYAIAHPHLITTLEKIRLPYNLPTFSQAAAQLALAHQDSLLEVIPQLLQERTQLWHNLEQIPRLKLWPTDANFIYARLKDIPESEEVLAHLVTTLKTQGTLIRHTGGGLRITVGSPPENQRTCQRMSILLANGLLTNGHQPDELLS